MATGYDAKFYHDIDTIAQSLNRIANCMEAAEKRAREREGPRPTTPEDIERMGTAIRSAGRGFAELEADRQASIQDREAERIGPGHEARGRGEIT